MGNPYPNPPILEVVCEFRLIPGTHWDPGISESVYDRMRHEYPIRTRRMVPETVGPAGSRGRDQEIRPMERILLYAEDKKTFLQLGPFLFFVNRLAPYPGWDEFRSRVKRAFVPWAGWVGELNLEKIALRFINRIELPIPLQKTGDYFSLNPVPGPAFSDSPDHVSLNYNFSYYEGRDQCRVQLTGSNPQTPDRFAYFLDLEYSLAKPHKGTVEETIDWIDTAHEKIVTLFEASITDALRGRFGLP
jgi:uncharacterized protein (TIGR04255 family)